MKSRTENAGKNLIATVIYQITNIIMKFGMRTIFVYCLGKEYLGVNGVFSNILSMLSLAELGLGSAIVYDMYKPVAEGNEEKICQYLKLYKAIYTFIGCFILLAGVCLIPFLDKILTDVPNVEHIKVIYILFLLKTSISYFWAEYTSLLGIYQMEYINKRYLSIFAVIKSAVESVFLLITRNYIIYLVIEIVLMIISNYCIYKKAIVLFPFIRKKVLMLKKEEVLAVCKNALGTFSIKFNGTVLGATDNLIISALISTVLVGIYSNYDMVIQMVLFFTVMIKNAVTGGVGNLCAKESKDKKYEVFKKIFFLYGSIYMVVAVCLLNLLEPFILLWLGVGYHLDKIVVCIVVFNCYLSGMLQPIEIYTFADGLFVHYKWKPWIEAAINLIVSVILTKYFGLIGVFLGTTISKISTSIWFDAYIVYHYSFQLRFNEYWKRFMCYLGITVIVAILSYWIVSKVNIFVGKVAISLGLSFIVWLGVFYRTEEFIFYKRLLIKRMKREKN
ncbi:MAG: polysaccharide biosynthesis C-terminal domain-containing protein [Butyrivibrio sp.]|nr:polysaccharide biosynthesis C-terminal domain-containing protein [Butyrivibrio sp.]